MNVDEVGSLFRDNTWFTQLPESVIAELVAMCKLKKLHKGQMLHAKGDIAEGFYCVLSGKMRISNVNHQGKEMVLTWLEHGSWFGEISLFDGLPRTHDAFAEDATTLLLLPNHSFQSLLTERPALYPHFMRLLCQRIRATFSLIDETSGLSLSGQLAKRLLLLANGLTTSQLSCHTSTIRVSQESLARMINTSRQTINGLLKQLKQQNVLAIHYGKIEILDIDRLKYMSEL